MSTQKSINLIVPTYDRADLLTRLLTSITESGVPASLERIIVVENGIRGDAGAVCQQFADRLPVEHLYIEQAGLSIARNAGIAIASGDILIFLDDDVRLLPGALEAYSQAMNRHGDSAFYGGPLQADYDTEPEPWLLEFLPWSAKGHSLGDTELEITRPGFLGGNFAVPRKAILEGHSFDTLSNAEGKSGGGLGEEIRLQGELLAAGYKGVYVPGGGVGHYVPTNQCDQKFVIHRKWREGYGVGRLEAEAAQQGGTTAVSTPKWYFRELLKTYTQWLLTLLRFKARTDRFKSLLELQFAQGRISGFRSMTRADSGQ